MISTKFDDFRFAVPTCWTVDLTPPTQEEWELEEIKNTNPFVFSVLQGAWYLSTIPTMLRGAIEEYVKAATKGMRAIQEVGATLYYLDEAERNKHGTYTVHGNGPPRNYTVGSHQPKSKKVRLPPRKTNTGPPWDPHKKGGKGGRARSS